MKSPLEQMSDLELVINQLRKTDRLLEDGKIIRSFRENGKILSLFEKTRIDIINNAKCLKVKDTAIINQIQVLQQIQDLEEVIRQLHKISSLIYVGQIVSASGCNNKLISLLKRKQLDLMPKEPKEIIIK